MNWLIHLRIAGLLLITLALSHIWFPRRFAWLEDSRRLSPINRQIFLVHSFFIALVVLMMGILTLVFGELLVARSPLRDVLLAGLAIFWGLRLIFQLFVYDRRLWRSDLKNTLIHVGLTCFWSYLVFVFGGLVLAG